MVKIPEVELSDCIKCEICIEVSPSVFRMNSAGFIEVIELVQYPEQEVDEAIKNCPTNCISWNFS